MHFALTAKLIMNMHDLNNERAEEIRRVPVVYRTRDGFKLVSEAVAVSGVILKRYHFVNFIQQLMNVQQRNKICLACSRFEGIRLIPTRVDDKDVAAWLSAKDEEVRRYREVTGRNESEIIQCPGEDLHGFLRERPPARRESLVHFSWMLPTYVESIYEETGTTTPFLVVQHTRVIKNIPEEAGRELRELQMPYPRAYGNGIFGFSSIVHLEHVGYSFTEAKRSNNVSDDEVKERRRVAILAYTPIVTGLAGATLARALPSCKPLEVVAYVAPSSPISIPSPSHPIYDDYVEQNVKMYKSFANLFKTKITVIGYGVKLEEGREKNFEVKLVKELYDVFAEALRELGLETT